jgi:AcrR family transcriptional regulator
VEKRIGRPRDPRIDQRIMRETRRQLKKHGYRGLRVAAVAEAAGVTAPTVRLRWPTKAELVHDAMFTDADEVRVPDTGSLVGDVDEAVANALASFSSPEMKAGLLGLVEDMRSHPELRRRIDGRLRQPAIKAFTSLLDRAVARGEIDALPVASAETILDTIAGSMVMRLLVYDESPAGLHEELVDLVLRGIGVDPTQGARRASSTRRTARRARR